MAVSIAAALIGAPLAAQADGTESGGVRLQLGGSNSAAGAAKSTEHGVTIWRGQPSLAIGLAGGEEAPAPQAAPASELIVVHHFHSSIRHLRTQGFYSGHPGKSRRFTQGFYSGPVDKGRTIWLQTRSARARDRM